jgi:hypothetical protein
VAEEERALALAEIEKARTAIAIVEKGLQEHDAASSSREKEEIEGLRKEVREARRIKMLHQPSKVMDMEFELKALRTLIAEKNQLCNQLMKELAMIKRLEEDSSDLYDLEGSDILGSQFCIIPRFDDAPDISSCPTQWYRVISGGNRNLILGMLSDQHYMELVGSPKSILISFICKAIIAVISFCLLCSHVKTVHHCFLLTYYHILKMLRSLSAGATKPTYAPEPFDVGRLLQAEIVLNAEKVTIQTMGPINPG